MDGGQGLPDDAGSAQGDAQPMAAGAGAHAAGGAGGYVGDADAAVKDSGSSGAGAAGSGGAGGTGGGSAGAGAGGAGAGGSGGAGGAGGTGGAAGSDEPGDDPTQECMLRTGVLLCNGFESEPFEDQWNYAIIDNGAGELSSSIRHSGVGALRASTGSARKDTSVRYATNVLNQRKSGHIWSRYYYYLPSSTRLTTWISSGVMSEIAKPYDGFDLLIHENFVEIESMAGYFTDGIAFPRDRWVCVELHALIASNGFFEAYLDGLRVAQTNPANTVPATGFTVAEFGIHYADYRQGPVVVYVDDVAVGTERIGCD